VREQISRREVVPSGVLEPSEEWLSPAVDAADASELAEMAGRIAQTRLMPGDIVLRSQVEEPIAIERNALVELIYHGNGFVLKAKGRARQPGRVGELIEVRVEDSRSSILARVDGPGRVIVVQ
jgi:flagellar basal body P-ring formation protein FlgA